MQGKLRVVGMVGLVTAAGLLTAWDQVRKWDGDHDDRLSDREIDVFRKAEERIPGGPDCGRSERPRR